ncbi:MAG: response regulator [Candidatus Omnitrophota bacterium]
MKQEQILIVDDDPDIRDVLKIVLEGEGYEVVEAADGVEALEKVHMHTPDLVVLDYKMPKMDGHEVCKILKRDILLVHLPIIMLTGKGETQDKVRGIDAGADDYIVKPFEPTELVARIKMILRRTERNLDASPLTRLPGNVSIIGEIEERIKLNLKFAVCYIDLDKFKTINDKYGFDHGDQIIKQTARIIIKSTKSNGNPNDFIGHIGGDDFVVITTPEAAEKICEEVINEFDNISPTFYSRDDREKGYIISKDRRGKVKQIPLLSISIGIVSNVSRDITHIGQIGEIGAELKKLAKSKEGSNYVKDSRKI